MSGHSMNSFLANSGVIFHVVGKSLNEIEASTETPSINAGFMVNFNGESK